MDFGGSTEADIVAGKDTWQRIPSFLQAPADLNGKP
jgi:hypothetical protein